MGKIFTFVGAIKYLYHGNNQLSYQSVRGGGFGKSVRPNKRRQVHRSNSQYRNSRPACVLGQKTGNRCYKKALIIKAKML